MAGNCLPVAKLHALAAEQTTTWAVWNTKRERWLTVTAANEKEALRKGGKNATVARPRLSTKEWAALPRPCTKKGRARR